MSARRHLTAAAAEGIGGAEAIAPGPADDRLRTLLDRLATTILPRRIDIAAQGAAPVRLCVDTGRIWRMGDTDLSEDDLPALAAALSALAEAPAPITLQEARHGAARPARLPGLPVAALREALSVEDAGPHPPADRLTTVASMQPVPGQDWPDADTLLIASEDFAAGPLSLRTAGQSGHAPPGSLTAVVDAWLGRG